MKAGGADTMNGRLSILIYHRVRAEPDPMFPEEVDAARFSQQMAVLARFFKPLPLAEAIGRMRNGSLPSRAVAVTFDDGYADNLAVAAPILARHRVPATLFVATGYLDGGAMWNDIVIESLRRTRRTSLDLAVFGLCKVDVGSVTSRRLAADAVIEKMRYLPDKEREESARLLARMADVEIPRDLMLTSDGVRALHASGFGIGAHTVTHPILVRLPLAEARNEIVSGRGHLETMLDEHVDLFAYPNGKPEQDFAADHARLLRELGFVAGLTTAWGAASATSDVFQLPRFTPWDRFPLAFALRLARYRFATPPKPLQ